MLDIIDLANSSIYLDENTPPYASYVYLVLTSQIDILIRKNDFNP